MCDQDFVNWLYSLGRHKHTVEKHIQALKVIKREVGEITEPRVRSFFALRKQRGLKNATINHYLDTLHLYLRFIGKENTLKAIRYLKKEYAVKGIFTHDELEKLLTMCCPSNKDKKIFDLFSLYLKLLCFTGARPGEISVLRPENFEPALCIVRLFETKTKTPRIICYPECLNPCLLPYLKKPGYIFTTRRGNIFSHASYDHQLKYRLKALNINRPNISLYSLRHSFITHMLEEGDILKIAKQCGTSVKMIEQNYAHLTTKDIATLVKRHPLVRKRASKEEVIKELEQVIAGYLTDTTLKYQLTKNDTKFKLVISA